MNKLWRSLKIIVSIGLAVCFYLLYVQLVEAIYAYFRINSCIPVLNNLQNFTSHYHKKKHATVFNVNNIVFKTEGRVCSDQSNILMTLCIISSPRNFEARQAIRKTWASQSLEGRVNYIFMVGKYYKPQVNNLVWEESAREKDVVIIDFLDYYRNLTFKSVAMLKWSSMFCSKSKYIVKIDDDIFIDIPSLFNLLLNMKSPKIIIGYIMDHSRPTRRKRSKWFVSDKDFSAVSFPSYSSGFCYVISSDLLDGLLEAVSKSHVLPVEDLYITGICGAQAGATLVGNCGFNHHYIPVPNWAQNSINFIGHKYWAWDMYAIWNIRNTVISQNTTWLTYLSYFIV